MSLITLTRQQFKSKRPQGSYAKYLSYLRAHRHDNQPRASADPYRSYDPTTPGPTPPWLLKQARSEVQSQIDPIIADITRSYNDRAAAGTESLKAYGESLANSLAGLSGRIGGYYSTAQQNEASLDAALRQALSGQGQSLANALSLELARTGQDTSPAAGVAATGAGAGNAAYAIGSASLAQLLSQGAAAQAYGAKLPGIAGLEGLQRAGALQRESSAGLADALGQIRSEVPGLVTSTTQNLKNWALQQWLARTGFATDTARINTSAANAAAAEAGRNARAGAAEAGRNARANASSIVKAQAKRKEDMTDASTRAHDLAVKLRERTKTESKYGKNTDVPDPAPYREAFGAVLALLGPLTPWMSAKQRYALARQALKSAGYTGYLLGPGEAGQRTGPAPETPGGPRGS